MKDDSALKDKKGNRQIRLIKGCKVKAETPQSAFRKGKLLRLAVQWRWNCFLPIKAIVV